MIGLLHWYQTVVLGPIPHGTFAAFAAAGIVAVLTTRRPAS